MGVSLNIYSVYGIKLNYNDIEDKDYDSTGIDSNGLFTVFDGMSGKYIVLGKLLFDSGDSRWGFEDTKSDMELVDVNSLLAEEAKLKSLMIEKYPTLKDKLQNSLAIINFMHYS